MLSRLKHPCFALVALAAAACTSQAQDLTSAGTVAIPPAASAAATVADATLPPPSAISPTAKTIIDDKAIILAWDALDLARITIDGLITLKKIKPGSAGALDLARNLTGSKNWLIAATEAQRAGQAESYRVALDQAALAMANVKRAIAIYRGEAQ